MRLLIVDGHAYAYRAFYAIRELRSPAGRAVNAIFGFIKMLGKLRVGLSPSHLVVVWDGGLSAERSAVWPAYKAQRPELPADLGEQIDCIERYLSAAGVASVCQEGIEADDLIAGVARRASVAGWDVVIASSDKDFMQLVFDAESGGQRAASNGRIGLLNPNDKSETVWGAEQVRSKAGVEPEQVVDWLSLVGDAVDNIPGVPGVGAKTAAALLREFGSVAGVYERLAEVKSERSRVALAQSEEIVRRNQNLVRLKEDVGGALELDEFAVMTADEKQLSELFREWGFRGMLAELVEAKQTVLI